MKASGHTSAKSREQIDKLTKLARHEHGELAELYARERAKTAAQIGSTVSSQNWHQVAQDLRREAERDV